MARLWNSGAPLTATGLVMLGWLAAAAVGLAFDDRLITGAPAWLKPAKFAASIAIYTLTLAWIFTLLPAWHRTRRVVGWITAVTLLLEMVPISLQAWRGVPSHFNVSSAFDGAVFAMMGLAILTQTLATIAVAVAAWRQRFEDEGLGWAVRLGLTLTLVGALTGGLMTRPTAEQLAIMQTGGRVAAVGAHTIGAADGGPGLPGTGWSTEHGDLRVAHFAGLHAMQVLPLFALLLYRRRVAERTRVRLTQAAAGMYATLFLTLLAQALLGQPLLGRL